MVYGRSAIVPLWIACAALMVGDRIVGVSEGQWLPFAIVSWVVAIIATVGVLRRPRGERWVAGPIAAGLVANAVSDVFSSTTRLDDSVVAVWVGDWLWVLFYPLAALALWRMLVPALKSLCWFDGILDTVTVILVAALMIPAVPVPPVLIHDESGVEPFVLIFFALWDAILFSLFVRTLMVRGGRWWVRSPLEVGVTLLVLSDIFALTGEDQDSALALFADVVFMLGLVLMAFSALDEPAPEPAPDVQLISTRSTLLISGVPMLIPPLLFVLAYWRDHTVDPGPWLLGMSGLFLVAFIRVRGLLRLLARSNAELMEARDAALSASRAKSAFLATISHEIRTPMNGIVGLNKLLIDTPLESDQREYAEGVNRASGVLLTLIEDILDMSHSESGLLTLDRLPMVPGDVAHEVVQAAALSAEQKGLALELNRDASANQVVLGDPARLRQVLLNLVGNAVKFTQRGVVRVDAWTEDIPVADETTMLEAGVSEGRRRVCFEVVDTGIGISDVELSRIFDPFVQADSSATRSHGGSGLGLAISQRLVELMGGAITVISRPGGGSRFQVRVPLALTTETPDVEQEDYSPSSIGAGARILVVEDDPVSQLVSEAMLKRLGHTVVVVASGEAALARMGEHWDAVLMDCHMPGMSGFEATEEWRAREHSERRVPVIAMTASILEEDRRRCVECGMNDFVGKPVILADLDAVLARRLQAARVGG